MGGFRTSLVALGNNRVVTLVNPVHEFKQTMKVVRKRFLGEAVLDAKEAVLIRQAATAKRHEQAERMREDIAAFKAATRAEQQQLLGGNSSRSSDVDAVIGDALGLQGNRQRHKRERGGGENDEKTGGAKRLLAKFVGQRREARAAGEAARQAALGEDRRRALLYLLHTSDSFVTRATLDARIDACWANQYATALPSASSTRTPFAGPALDHATLERLAVQALAAAAAKKGAARPANYDAFANAPAAPSPNAAAYAYAFALDADDAAGDAATTDAGSAASQIEFLMRPPRDPSAPPAKAPHSHASFLAARLSPSKGAPHEVATKRHAILSDLALAQVAARPGLADIAAHASNPSGTPTDTAPNQKK
ncbi:hypothetical protein HK100_009067 [Physocladia obscura]|uniref:Uncharacterized protein n=1 Tax=Physocladia obscura TaxID=109957 RepID=A0AAD5XED8_9FUNG|nr:hypothetical protein HK100_009067 [Physocladia obscura]